MTDVYAGQMVVLLLLLNSDQVYLRPGEVHYVSFKQTFKKCLRCDSKTPYWDCENERSETWPSSSKEQLTWVLSLKTAHCHQNSCCLEITLQHRRMTTE